MGEICGRMFLDIEFYSVPVSAIVPNALAVSANWQSASQHIDLFQRFAKFTVDFIQLTIIVFHARNLFDNQHSGDLCRSAGNLDLLVQQPVFLLQNSQRINGFFAGQVLSSSLSSVSQRCWFFC